MPGLAEKQQHVITYFKAICSDHGQRTQLVRAYLNGVHCTGYPRASSERDIKLTLKAIVDQRCEQKNFSARLIDDGSSLSLS